MPEKKPRQVQPHTPGPGYVCSVCDKPHVLGCRRDLDPSLPCENVSMANERIAETVERLRDRTEPVVKSCPFCAAPAVTERYFDLDGRPEYFVQCSGDCAASPCVLGGTPEEALTRWNMRAPAND